LFGLPHLLFLFLAWPLGRYINLSNARSALARFSALTCAGLLLQVTTTHLAMLIAGRLMMGIGMTGAYLAINSLAASTTQRASAGRHFGNLEGANKWGLCWQEFSQADWPQPWAIPLLSGWLVPYWPACLF
jgi:MFS family permease